MPTLMETTLKFDCTRLEEQVFLNKEKDVQLDTRVTALENKETPVYTPMDLDLNTGIVALTYDTIDGLSLTTQGTIKSNTGTDPVVVDYSIPMIGSDTISIDLDQANNKLVFKVDPTANLKCNSLTAENVSGSVTQSTKLNYDGRITITNPAGTKQFSIPWNYGDGSLLTDKCVKTIFDKSIVGSGNIGFYRHKVHMKTSANTVMLIFLSSSDVKITFDSLASNANGEWNKFIFGTISKTDGKYAVEEVDGMKNQYATEVYLYLVVPSDSGSDAIIIDNPTSFSDQVTAL